jgi:hypothetical protein
LMIKGVEAVGDISNCFRIFDNVTPITKSWPASKSKLKRKLREMMMDKRFSRQSKYSRELRRKVCNHFETIKRQQNLKIGFPK